MNEAPGVLGFVEGLGVGGNGNDAEPGVLAAVDLQGDDEGVVAVVLLGHLGTEVASEDLEGAAGDVAGNPPVHPFEVAEKTLGGFVGAEGDVDLLRSVHQTEPGVVCSRMDAERPLMWWRMGGERPLARPLMPLL